MSNTLRLACLLALLVGTGFAEAFDPLTSAVSKGIATAMDVRSKTEVKDDVEIDAALSSKLATHKGDDFKDVSVLVFARHAVLVGFAKSAEVRGKAEELAKADKRIRSLKNEILVGSPSGGMARNFVLDEKIGFALKAARGVNSVNMRWKVYGGEVFLMGVTKSRKEADLATARIRGLDGVKDLHSNLSIGRK